MGAAMVLKRVGFFREVRERLRENVRGLPSIHDAVRDIAHPDEDRILNYLREGVCLLACGGVMPDVPSRPANGILRGVVSSIPDNTTHPGGLDHGWARKTRSR
jgi:hypothetical protein